MRATGSHRIVRHGNDRMVLSDCKTGQAVITARRDEGTKTWTLTADGADDRVIETDETRDKAVSAMIQFAFDHTPGSYVAVQETYRIHADGKTRIHLRAES